ncbi:MAG: SatD family protein [Imperialibacter sp.]|uniref:SatD family protein n=1 Tax=Imperialibacter sp. TaxID=2038411 RepID=UPI0032ECBE36
MGDIVGSTSQNGAQLMMDFKKVIEATNKKLSDYILSPLTVTLGDEFQGVMMDLLSCLEAMFYLDELVVSLKQEFKIRYSVQYGVIDTPINEKSAHEMLGKGLVDARRGLEMLKNKKTRHHLATDDFYLDSMLNGIFQLYDSIYRDWSLRDKEYLTVFFENDDYKEVSKKLGKDPSTVWRKRISLKLDQFFVSKSLLRLVASNKCSLQ